MESFALRCHTIIITTVKDIDVFQYEQSKNNLDTDSNELNVSSPRGFGSNQDRILMLQERGASIRLNGVFSNIIEGRLEDARLEAHDLANEGRANGDQQLVDWAGNIWTVSDRLTRTQDALAQKDYAQAKVLANEAANTCRSLVSEEAIDVGKADQIIQASGGYWSMADTAQKEQNKGDAKTDTPIIDQHQLNHERNWAFCGIASMLMVLEANGQNPAAETRAEIQSWAQGIYVSGEGTSGAGMAQRLRDNGVDDARFTLTGTSSRIVDTLDKGQPVPLGVLHVEGTVVKLKDGRSQRYPHRQVGDQHYRDFSRGSGHWVVVIDYEGEKENPTHFLVNDPDVGGTLRVSKAGLEDMGVGNGNMWTVYQ